MKARTFVLLALGLVGCTKNGSLVAVTVDADPPLADVAKLSVTITAGGRTQTSSVALSPAMIPPQQSFGIDVGPSVSGEITVALAAVDSMGQTVSTTSGSTTITVGGTASLPLFFGIQPPDMAMSGDLAGADLSGADLSTGGDMALPPLVFTNQVLNGGLGPFYALWGADATHLWISGHSSANTYFSTGNDTWTQFSTNPFYDVNSLFGFSPTSGWMVDNNGDIRILDSTGTSWGQGANLSASGLSAVWGTSATNMWTVSNVVSPAGGHVYHNTTGANLVANWVDSHSEATGLNAIHGVAADNFYIAGDGGVMLHCDGVQYNFVGFGSGNLHGVWAANATHVYVVGDAGALGFSPGNNVFTQQTLPASATSTNLRAIWASGPNDIYVAGDGATLLHSTGNGTWTAIATGLANTHNLQAVFGTSARDVYAISSSGGIVHGK